MKLSFNNVLLIDGSYLLHRSHYVNLNLKSSDGVRTGALYGTLKSIYSYSREFKPLQIVIALDTVRTSFRNEIYPEYKQNRKEREEVLQNQFELLKEFCHAAKIPCLEDDNYEADDFLGSLAMKAREIDYSPYIVTGDKDLFQMINEDIKVLYISKSGLDLVGNSEVKERYDGLSASQLLEVKGLQGDNSDNIPGVKGIGEKTAVKLIKKYGSLDNIYQNIEDFSGKLKENLINDKDGAYLSKKLNTIKGDLDLEFPDNQIYDLNTYEVSSFLEKFDIYNL